jgi:uncharacterized membrane protein YfcA
MGLDTLAFPTLVFLLAGFIKGVIGLGLPAVGVGLLGLVMVPAQAAALLVVPSTVTNVWQLAAGPDFRALLRRLWPMLAGILAGSWAGAGALAGANSGRARVALGAVLAIYALLGVFAVRPRVPRRLEWWLGPLTGAVTGLVTAATGVFMIPAVPYLQGIGLEREDLIQALGLSFTISTLALATDLLGTGIFDTRLLLASTLALIPALGAMFLGQWLRRRIPAALFRRCFFIGLLLLGLELMAK